MTYSIHNTELPLLSPLEKLNHTSKSTTTTLSDESLGYFQRRLAEYVKLVIRVIMKDGGVRSMSETRLMTNVFKFIECPPHD